MATKAAPKATSADEAKPKKSKKMIIALALVILLAGGGAGAWYFMTQKAASPGHAAEKKIEEAAPPVFLPLEVFTVNLQAENGDQFLQTTLTLQVADAAQAELIKLYLPHVRNRLLLLLSGKKAAEILTVEGKNNLSNEILDIFKQPITAQGPTIKVSSVLFTSFVVQ